MADLNLDIVAEVVEACKAGTQEAAEALGRSFDTEVQLSVGEPGSVDVKALPEGLAGPGLVVVLTVGGTGALVLVPESSQLLPSWYGHPDPTGKSKLATLAQELGMLLLPEQYMPDDFQASGMESLGQALTRGGVSDGAALLPLDLQQAENAQATAYLIWPAASPAAVLGEEVSQPKPKAEPQPGPPSDTQSALEPEHPPQEPLAKIDDLPLYSRSLLRVKLPVVVTLARKPEPVSRVVELGPGSIIQFEKSCEEMLDLDVGGRSIATGEAVKVGDKFGLRINTMTLPDERFATVRKD